jgi:carbon-monoxide dehydrogenase medium subunit
MGLRMTDVERFSPESLDEAAALLLGAGGEIRPQADGTDLVVEVTEAQHHLYMVLDLRRIPELNRLEYDERNGLRIGAAVPLRTILEFPPVHRLYPMLADAGGLVGPGEQPETATLGGSLARADSAAEMAPPLVCLRASAAIFGPYGWSEMAVEALLAGAGKVVLQPGEFVVDLRIPALLPRSNGAYQGAVPPEQPNTVVGVGAFLVLEHGLATCCGARLTLGGVAPSPLRVLEAERFLSGKVLSEDVLQEAGELTARCALPGAGPTGERFDLVRGLARRAMAEALERVRAGARS